MTDGKRRKGKQERRPSPDREDADAVLLKALSHPVRARALTALNQRVASPSELASEQGKAVGHVAYHVRVLHELGMIELVNTRQVRGATQHFYRSSARPYFSNVSLDLDEQGWREAMALLNSCLKGLMKIGGGSEARKGEATIRATFGLMGFESPSAGGETKSAQS
jgi:DNA-binding transcriptional ArsR family regulator